MSAHPTRGQAAVARGSRARRSPGAVVLAFAVDNAILAGALALAAWATITEQDWTWALPALLALALTWEASEVSWDPRAEGPLPSARQLSLRGQVLAVGAVGTLALLPTGVDELPAAVLLAAATGAAVWWRVRGWSGLSAGHAPGTRLARAAGRMTADTGGRALVAVVLGAGLAGLAAGLTGSVAVAFVLLAVAAQQAHADPDADAVLLQVKKALAGLLHGHPWHPALAEAHTSPIEVASENGQPVRITLPLPTGLGPEQLDRLRVDLMAILAERWGIWLLTIDAAQHVAVALPEPPQTERALSVRRALAGLLSGGGGWDPRLAALGYAPVTVNERDDELISVDLPLPPAWTASTATDALREEVQARLAPYGYWATRVDASARTAVAVLAPPLPTFVPYDGRPAAHGSACWIGVGRVTREAQGVLKEGDLFDLVWDPASTASPHGIAVGTTGAGKSQTVQLIMCQLALAGWRLLLIDPKKVEFGKWAHLDQVLAVSTNLEDHVELLQRARAEMDARYDDMAARGVSNVALVPQEERPVRLLVVVDEVIELLATGKAISDEDKLANDLKGKAASSISEILRLGRAAGVHLLLAGQRADRTILSGEAQNNIGFRVLQGGGTKQVERTMIGIDLAAEPGINGRAAASLAGVQTEVQVAFLDVDRLDDYLPSKTTAAAVEHVPDLAAAVDDGLDVDDLDDLSAFE
jgi:hypothetical protein